MAIIFLVIFIALTIYTRSIKKHPIVELEITEYANGFSPSSPLSKLPQGFGYRPLPFSIVLYCARHCAGDNHIVTFKSIRNSPPYFPPYERGEKLQAHVSFDEKTIVPIKAVTGLRRLSVTALIIYLVVTLFLEVVPFVFSNFSSGNPELFSSANNINFRTLVPIMAFALFGVLFTAAGITRIINVQRLKRKRADGAFRVIPARVTNVIQTGFGEDKRFFPVFTYNISGKEEVHHSRFGQRPPKYKCGEHVTLYQNVETREFFEPTNFEIGSSFVFLGVGLFFLFLTAYLFVRLQ